MRRQICLASMALVLMATAITFIQPPAEGAKETPSSAKQSRATGGKSKQAPRKIDGSFINGKMVLSKYVNKNGWHKGEPVVVLVDKGSHFTYVMQKQNKSKVVLVYRASNAIGSDDTPTPFGPYAVADKLKWPSWIPPKSIDPKQKTIHPYNKDRRNPLGVARIGLNKFGIQLHGTNDPGSLRKDVSHGCVRHSNKDIMAIYRMVDVGTKVRIVRNFAGTVLTKKDFVS